MQTYTHLLMGLAGSAMFSPPLHKVLFVGASVAPDIPVVIKLIEGKIKGKDTLTIQSDGFVQVKNVLHSIPLAAFVVTLSAWFPLPVLAPIGVAWFLHCVVDLLTHGKKSYSNDQLFLWPSRQDITDIFGVWEYRYVHGVLRPKPFEAVVDVALLILIFLFFRI